MDRRAKFRLELSGLYLPFYDRLCELLHPEWQPYSGFRSFQAQDFLYAQGRTAPGGIVTNARGGESPHNYGCATDWTLWTTGGSPVWMEKTDDRWGVYVDAVTEAGLRAGLEFGDIDHNELKIAITWPAVLKIRSVAPSGLQDKAASDAIRDALF